MQARAIHHASGFALLDALTGILIFVIGILGLVAAQAVAMRAGGDAQFRLEASHHAASVLGAIRASDPATAALEFTSPSGPRFVDWIRRVDLPGSIDTPPTIVFSGNDVVVTLFWRSGRGNALHQVVVSGTIQ